MAEQDDLETPTGSSRRDLIKRGAAVGAVVWAVPMIDSFTSKASAATGSAEPGADISYLALLIQCDTSCSQYKFEIEDGVLNPTAECGDVVGTPDCTDMLDCPGTSCVGAAPTAVLLPDGTLRVTIPSGCRLLDFRVKCGQCCEGPGSEGQPTALQLAALVQEFDFSKCTGNQVGTGGLPCEPTPYTNSSK